MARFYVLPPLEHVELALSRFFADWLPGLPLGPAAARRMLEVLVGEPADDSAAFIVHRDHLPGSGNLIADLTQGFGAEDGDEAIEIAWDGRRTELKRHCVGALGIPEERCG